MSAAQAPATSSAPARSSRSTPSRKERLEHLVRTFEWTWTKAVLFAVGLVFFLLISTSVIPSFWLYYASNTLKWTGAGSGKLLFVTVPGFWLLELRDAIAMGLVTGPIITLLVAAAVVQNWRRKLRGSGG